VDRLQEAQHQEAGIRSTVAGEGMQLLWGVELGNNDQVDHQDLAAQPSLAAAGERVLGISGLKRAAVQTAFLELGLCMHHQDVGGNSD